MCFDLQKGSGWPLNSRSETEIEMLSWMVSTFQNSNWSASALEFVTDSGIWKSLA